MKHLFAAASVALVLVLSGCASSGNAALKEETAQTLSTKIAKGVTTQAQVRALLGAPSTTTFTGSGTQVWHYSHSKTVELARNYIPLNIFSTGANTKTKHLALTFDKQGVVQDYAMEESSSESREGVIPQ